MLFNIRFDTARDAPDRNRWSDRVGSVLATVRREDPDIVGFQEALRSQLADLADAFPDYHDLGKPRDVGNTAEYVPLFFRRDRFSLDEAGDFWMSPMPDVEGSRGWDADVPRHCTWAKLVDRRTQVPFSVFNTHLDRWGEVARTEAAKLFAERLKLAPGLAAVVMGDFNALEDSEPLEILRSAGLRDSFRDLYPDVTDVQTVHHYRDLSGDRKIDYIMCDENWRTIGATIVRHPAAGRLPSDHFPVSAELRPA